MATVLSGLGGQVETLTGLCRCSFYTAILNHQSQAHKKSTVSIAAWSLISLMTWTSKPVCVCVCVVCVCVCEWVRKRERERERKRERERVKERESERKRERERERERDASISCPERCMLKGTCHAQWWIQPARPEHAFSMRMILQHRKFVFLHVHMCQNIKQTNKCIYLSLSPYRYIEFLCIKIVVNVN